MEREQVKSSNIKSVGYDPALQLLEIEFQDGSVYQYNDVPRRVRDELMTAPSLGSYFHANIRGGYRYHKVM